jgi:hydrogenase maturation protease
MDSFAKILIIGIGNADRGDDAAGLTIARQLKEYTNAETRIIEQGGENATLIEHWQKAVNVFLLDAVSGSGKIGTIYRFEAHDNPIPAKFFNHSTHAFGVAEAIELARALHQLPKRLIVYGVEGKNYTPGAGLSSEVEKAVPQVVHRVRREIEKIRRGKIEPDKNKMPENGKISSRNRNRLDTETRNKARLDRGKQKMGEPASPISL